ncbi:hypothetical protein FHW69_000922 [Luteibacter sp. Sphag1AF]|uniref:DUF4156 domain-containing protein n=1 Tax=Luteibacter sp. Sphag1AF TaxID=2587031 RepID=UPI001613DCF5|nr:DUF4156 domain-containing protein [Luteibacter sp. Sphag1AF]MBB3226332.1 hypothetical protein [Luteibacter sp. Sphag1AF]
MRKILVLFVPVVLSACTWGIKLDDDARSVRTAWNGDVSSCQELGKVTVQVMNRVGPVDRNDLKVRDELEVLARNEAAKMHADTIKPLSEPSEGSQPWGAYTCGARGPAPGRSNAPAPTPPPSGAAPQGGFETVPLKN